MHFFDLNKLSAELNVGLKTGIPYTVNSVDALLDTLQIDANTKVERSELRKFLLNLDEKSLVFLGWIDGQQPLKTLLIEGKVSVEMDQRPQFRSHRLFENFQQFISPFLSTALLEIVHQQETYDVVKLLSFTYLLSPDERSLVENVIIEPLKIQRSKTLQSAESAKDENDLSALLSDLLSDENIRTYNFLSRALYQEKIALVELCFKLLKTEVCTPRLTNWGLKRLLLLDLNEEHLVKLETFKKELKAGRLRSFKPTNSRSVGFSRSTLLLLSFIILLSVLAYWLFKYNPFDEKERHGFEAKTSFEQFTQLERQQIDSILSSIKPKEQLGPDQLDAGHFFGNGISLELRRPFENKSLEQHYRDLLLDAEQHDKQLYDTCINIKESSPKDLRYPNQQDLRSRQPANLFISNESKYDCYIVVANPNKNGEIYGTYLSSKQNLSIHIEMNELIFFVAGKDPGKYIEPAKQTDPMSSNFNQHFCTVDYNYLLSISHVFQLSKITKNNKLLLSGTPSTEFQVIDIYSLLTAY